MTSHSVNPPDPTPTPTFERSALVRQCSRLRDVEVKPATVGCGASSGQFLQELDEEPTYR